MFNKNNNNSKKKNVTYKKCGCFFYEAKMIIEMREKLLTRGGVYILCDFHKGHK